MTTAGTLKSPAWCSSSGWAVVHPTGLCLAALTCPEHQLTAPSTPPAPKLQPLAQTIHHPSEEELVAVGAGFARFAGSAAFCRVAGSIDGCHIRVKPPAKDAASYLNRKLFYSVQLQAVVDHTAKFIDVCVGYPGSCSQLTCA